MLKYILLILIITSSLMADFLEEGTIILGRPTANKITFNILAKKSLEFYIEYGISKRLYTYKTETYTSVYPEPAEFDIINLESNRVYYYVVKYRENQNLSFISSDEYFFHTQRAKGTTFTFTIESDPHLYDKKGSSGLMKVNMENQAKDSADFILDLGDTFGDDHNPFTITDEQVKMLHIDNRQFFGKLCHSSPFFFCLGNHEGESGYYLLQTPPNNLAVYATKWRKKYYPNPCPDGFYSGNTDNEDFGIGMPENYYSFEWGDALFVVLDVYRYYTANEKPKKWDWTIGDKQYFWFRATLENSNARYKFVFAHHTLGQGRGGANESMLYEWGGYEDTNKSKWGFDENRPGWTKPIHQLMVDNRVQVYFQGHDHLFAKEDLGSIIYQEIPIPCDSTYEIGYLANADAYSGLILDGAGYLKVTVSDAEAKVEYVKNYLKQDETDSLKNGMIGYNYSVGPKVTEVKQFDETMEDLSAYPNPTTDYIMIQHPKGFRASEISKINICDAYGRCVLSRIPAQGNSTTWIDISFLPAGLYNAMIGDKVSNKFIIYR